MRPAVFLHTSTWLAACLQLAAACAHGAADDAPTSQPRICPDCTPSAPGTGGASSEGSVAACTLAYLERSVDHADAIRLGFPVGDAKAQIERPIDSDMTWVPKAADGGGPAAGYERQTRVRGAFHVDSYAYRNLDPQRCDGTRCKLDDGTTTEQAPCPERYIMMHVSGELQTLDGAISARFPTQAVNLRMPGQVDDLVVAAAADLHDARGSLVITPEVPPPRVGRLDLSVQFADSHQRAFGVLSVGVYPDWQNLPEEDGLSIPSRLAYYSPIEARWGEAPSGEPSVAGP